MKCAQAVLGLSDKVIKRIHPNANAKASYQFIQIKYYYIKIASWITNTRRMCNLQRVLYLVLDLFLFYYTFFYYSYVFYSGARDCIERDTNTYFYRELIRLSAFSVVLKQHAHNKWNKSPTFCYIGRVGLRNCSTWLLNIAIWLICIWYDAEQHWMDTFDV